MKKILAFVFSIMVIMSLSACGKSEAAIACEEAIQAVGTVTLDSKKALEKAETAYNALSDEEKGQISEASKQLAEFRKEYNVLSAQDLVDKIGNITVNSISAIEKAEKAYNALSEEEKALVSNIPNTLNNARKEYETAKQEANQKEADKVTALINSLGSVTLNSKSQIEEISNAYSKLSREAKDLVVNYSTFVSAKNNYETLVEAEKERLLKNASAKFTIEQDKVEGVTWYTSKTQPYYADTRSFVLPYIGVKSGQPWICIRYHYTGDSWVFWNTLKIVIDGQKYEKSVPYFDIIHDNDTEVWEYYDVAFNARAGLDTADLKMLRQIADSKETIIRFQGDSGSYDLTVLQKDKDAIRDVLNLYEALM